MPESCRIGTFPKHDTARLFQSTLAGWDPFGLHCRNLNSCQNANGPRWHGGNTVGGWTAKQIQSAVFTAFELLAKTYGLCDDERPASFAAPAASLYSVATGRASILRTIAPKSRLVRWLSASISQ